MVSQDCVLFARSVRENIKYGCEDASDEEMYKAAKLASAHDFIMELSNGYDTGSTHRLSFFFRVNPKVWFFSGGFVTYYFSFTFTFLDAECAIARKKTVSS